MSTETITAPTETPIAAPAAPKPAAKANKPKAVKKAPTKRPVAKAKPSANGHAKALSGLAAAHPKWMGKTCNFRRDGSLTARQIDVLRVLSKRTRPAPASDVADALKVSEASRKTVNWAIGAVRTETQDPFSLIGRKLVRHVPVEADGRTDHLFEITASGKAALAKAKA